jgi:hypothetical protein
VSSVGLKSGSSGLPGLFDGPKLSLNLVLNSPGDVSCLVTTTREIYGPLWSTYIRKSKQALLLENKCILERYCYPHTSNKLVRTPLLRKAVL